MELPAATAIKEGAGLRRIRLLQKLTLKQVEIQSRSIAAREGSAAYQVTAGRLSQIENNNSLPGLYKLASLSEIYQVPYRELLQLYSIESEPWLRSG